MAARAAPGVEAGAGLRGPAVPGGKASALDRRGRSAKPRPGWPPPPPPRAAAPATAAVYSMQMDAEALASYDASATLSEEVRKSATYRALRYSRGKADDT